MRRTDRALDALSTAIHWIALAFMLAVLAGWIVSVAAQLL